MSTSQGLLDNKDVDTNTCDREPIHIPGAIQPHGILLSLDPTKFSILQASENASDVFERSIEHILGASLPDLLATADSDRLLRGLRDSSLERNPVHQGSFELGPQGKLFHAIAHRYNGALILEFEAASDEQEVSFHSLYPLVRSFMARVEAIENVPDLSKFATEEIRRITKFDRVLLYRFSEDWHGQVIGESREEGLSPYLDLWFPASDIPAQARELYRLNRLRLIADVHYKPVPLVPAVDAATGKPLDLSYAALRSVSPIHIEYLMNMGVGASMSISVIRDGKLWGLIALHHKEARRVSFEVRVACDLLGQALSAKVATMENEAEYKHRLHLKSISTKLLGFMAEEERFVDGLVEHPDELLAFGSASGVAVLLEDNCFLLGKTPPGEQVNILADWLARKNHDVFFSDSISMLMDSGKAFSDTASGVLAISISKLYSSYVIWFRPEIVKTVEWSGNPEKPADPSFSSDARISPRRSFETWKQTVRGKSIAWRPSEIESAAELRNAVVGVVLRKAEELAALSAELSRSNSELEAFSYSVSHDLRAPFRHIVGYADLLREHLEGSLDDTARRYIQTISKAAELAGVLVDNLLNFSRVGRAKLRATSVQMSQLLEEVRRDYPQAEEKHKTRWEIDPLPSVYGDPVLLRLVWQNLLSNALKFSRMKDEPRIQIRVREESREWIFSVSDNGVGFKQVYADKLFAVFQRLHTEEEFEGIGIGLANVRRAIGKHGGRTWAEGEIGKGATVYFSLPQDATSVG